MNIVRLAHYSSYQYSIINIYYVKNDLIPIKYHYVPNLLLLHDFYQKIEGLTYIFLLPLSHFNYTKQFAYNHYFCIYYHK